MIVIEEGHLLRAMPQSATSRRRCGYTAPVRTWFLSPSVLPASHAVTDPQA